MKKPSLSFLHNLSDDDKIFVNMISDKIYAAEEKYRTSFTFFLTEARAELARQVLASQSFENYLFFGGFEQAERVVLGIFQPFETPDISSFPIEAVTYSFRKQDCLSHRDFLGALMGLNISRETVGDILVSDGTACVFLTSAVAHEAYMGITKVGRAGVKAQKGFDEEIIPKREFQSVSGTVSSLRLDCIVSLATRCSRAKAELLISAGAVSVRGQPVENGSKKIDEGDVFSVRGSGKFILEKIGKSTKKDRTFIELKKFI